MDFYPRRRKWILLLAAGGASGYAAYRVYNLPSVVERRRKISKLVGTLITLVEAVASSAETISLASSDLNRFLLSDSDEIPASLKQLSKIARSDEFVGSISSVSEALTVGIVRGIGSSSSSGSSKGTKSELADRILDKLLSSSGAGFASVVVGSFARNLVIGFYSSRSNEDSDSGSVPSSVQLICGDEKCRALIANCVQLFVSSAVAVFLEKTMDINTYDELFAGITNPKHEAKVKELMVSVCNGAVETLIKTSHQVLTNPGLSSSADGAELEQNEAGLSVGSDKRSFDMKEQTGGWFNQVSSTLAVPSNRSFVLDVTGRVTFETVRSFLDFLLWKLYDGAKRSVHSVREGAVERGVEVVRYFSAKSMLVVTICLALCMRVLAGTRVLLPA